MKTIGIIVPPVPGHVMPSLAQADALRSEGCRVRYYQLGDLRDQIEEQGHEFCALGASRFQPGMLAEMRSKIASMSGLRCVRASVELFRATAEMFGDELPAALAREPVDALLIDQIEPAPALIARALGIPYVSVANALPMDPDPWHPPATTPWLPGGGIGELRNCLAHQMLRVVFRPTYRLLRKLERRHGLPREPMIFPYLSEQAQINQLVEAFDFPRKHRPAHLHYLGAMRLRSYREIPFDFDRLDGRPLVYASLGTTVCRHLPLLRKIAEIARGRDVQLVLSLGGQATAAELGAVPENALVVEFAPQPELIGRADAVITHAGQNTTMEAIAKGKPMVAVPISYEQPGIAARIERAGIGLRCSRKASTASIGQALDRVLSEPGFANSATQLAKAGAAAGGAERAAEIVISMLQTGCQPPRGRYSSAQTRPHTTGET